MAVSDTISQRALLLRLLDEAYDHDAWHGPNLLESVGRVKAAQAAWRPGPGEKNIWEIVVHAAYWRYAMWRRLADIKRGSFPMKGSDWFERPLPGEGPKAWKADLALLAEMHRNLREAIATMPEAELMAAPMEGTMTPAERVIGIAFHDIYHAGQVQALKRRYKAEVGRR